MAGTVEERMIQRTEKKLLLEMVNRDSHSNTTMDPEQQDSDAVARGFSATELWENIKFGCEAVFGNSSNNELPSEEDIAVITNQTRKESDSVGKLMLYIKFTIYIYTSIFTIYITYVWVYTTYIRYI